MQHENTQLDENPLANSNSQSQQTPPQHVNFHSQNSPSLSTSTIINSNISQPINSLQTQASTSRLSRLGDESITPDEINPPSHEDSTASSSIKRLNQLSSAESPNAKKAMHHHTNESETQVEQEKSTSSPNNSLSDVQQYDNFSSNEALFSQTQDGEEMHTETGIYAYAKLHSIKCESRP